MPIELKSNKRRLLPKGLITSHYYRIDPVPKHLLEKKMKTILFPGCRFIKGFDSIEKPAQVQYYRIRALCTQFCRENSQGDISNNYTGITTLYSQPCDMANFAQNRTPQGLLLETMAARKAPPRGCIMRCRVDTLTQGNLPRLNCPQNLAQHKNVPL